MIDITDIKVINKKLGFSLSYTSKEAFTSKIAIEYEKAGFRIEEATISAYCSQIDLSEDRAYVNKKSIPVLYGKNTKFTASKDDTKFEMTLSMAKYSSERNINFSIGQGTFKALLPNSYVDRATFTTNSNLLKYTNNTEVPLIATHCTIIRQNSTGRDTSIMYLNETDNTDIIGNIIYPGQTIEFENPTLDNARCHAFLVLREVYEVTTRFKTKRQTSIRKTHRHSSQRKVSKQHMLRIRGTKRKVIANTLTKVKHTRRYVSKIYNKRIDTNRDITNIFETRFYYDTKREVIAKTMTRLTRVFRKVAALTETKVKHTRRYINKNYNKRIDTNRKMTQIGNARVYLGTKRILTGRDRIRIYTRRRIVHGPQSSTIWLDTKFITLNRIKSKGPITRHISNNVSTSIPQTLRPVVWIYKLNDGHPIDLNTIRTIHKSTDKDINTLRRVEHDFYYTTTFSTHRNISNSINTSIKSNRQVIKQTISNFNSKRQLIKNYNLYSDTLKASYRYANEPISTIRTTSLSDNLNIMSNRQVIDYGHSKLKTIRRISKDNCICCNALTNRKVINDFSTSFNTIRTATTTNEADIKTNRLIAINYISGYAFTKRCITTNMTNYIDSYRYVTNITTKDIDIVRRSTVYDWFYNPTTRHIVNEVNRAYLTNRKVVRDIFVSQDTSRSSYHKIEPNLDIKREIIKEIDKKIDTKRRIAAEISNDIDVTKKIAAKYIYLNKGQRQIVKSIEQDIDVYRQIRKVFVDTVDTLRKVESDNIADTLCVNFELKHGNLYEIDRCFYKAE